MCTTLTSETGGVCLALHFAGETVNNCLVLEFKAELSVLFSLFLLSNEYLCLSLWLGRDEQEMLNCSSYPVQCVFYFFFLLHSVAIISHLVSLGLMKVFSHVNSCSS